MGPSPTYHPPEAEECETSVEHGLPLWAEPAVGYCSRQPRLSPMWGSRFVGARAVAPWVGEQKPLGKTPLRGNPSPELTYPRTLKEGRARKPTHTPTPQPGVAGQSRNQSPSIHTHTAHPSQERWGTRGRAHTEAHRHPNTPARSDGAQPEPQPNHTYPHCTRQPRVAGDRSSARANAQTPQHFTREWQGTAETRAQANTPTPYTPPRSGGVQAERAQERTGTPTPRPGVAGSSRNPSPCTHTHTPPGVAGYKQSTHTQTPKLQPGVAGRSRSRSPSARSNTAHPSQGWRGTSGARTQTHTNPHTPARSGGAQPTPEPKHTHPRRTPQAGVAGYMWSKHTNTHTPRHFSGEWRGAAKTGAQAQTPTPHSPARSGGVQAERAHAHPATPARNGRAQPKREPKHTHQRSKPRPGVAG